MMLQVLDSTGARPVLRAAKRADRIHQPATPRGPSAMRAPQVGTYAGGRAKLVTRGAHHVGRGRPGDKGRRWGGQLENLAYTHAPKRGARSSECAPSLGLMRRKGQRWEPARCGSFEDVEIVEDKGGPRRARTRAKVQGDGKTLRAFFLFL